MVVTDHFSRFAQAYPTTNQTAATVARTLWSQFIMNHEIPQRINSDQGRCFSAEIIHELYKLLNIDKSRTTTYHPQGNGMTERFNSTLLNMLGTLSPSRKVRWRHEVSNLTFAYNSTKHASTGFCPFYLFNMWEPRIPLDLACPAQSYQDTEDMSPEGFVESLQKELRLA